jgi:hypothetical protein
MFVEQHFPIRQRIGKEVLLQMLILDHLVIHDEAQILNRVEVCRTPGLFLLWAEAFELILDVLSIEFLDLLKEVPEDLQLLRLVIQPDRDGCEDECNTAYGDTDNRRYGLRRFHSYDPVVVLLLLGLGLWAGAGAGVGEEGVVTGCVEFCGRGTVCDGGW